MLPKNVKKNFEDFCLWEHKQLDYEMCIRNEAVELAKFNAIHDKSNNDLFVFENEACYNWFLLRWS
jgi:hypothetical protein